MEPETTALPATVRKQAEDADALHRKLYPDQYPKTDGAQIPVHVEGDAAKPVEGDKGKETLPAKPPETAKPAESKVEGTAEEWKQKYETLQGKYNAEVPQLHATSAALRNQLQESLTRIKTLEEEKAQGPTGKEPGDGKGGGEEEITDPTLKSFKDEYPDIFEAVKKMVAPKPGEPAKPAAPKPDAAAAPATSDARQTMLYYLGRDIPNWKEINKDAEFIRSLDAIDPLTGKTKLESLNLAYAANDFTTVIGYFRDFKPVAAAAPAAPAEGRELTEEEKALAPPRGNRAPGAPGGEAPPVVTPQDLSKFYDEARRGLWGPINQDKYLKEEARLLAALMRAKT